MKRRNRDICTKFQDNIVEDKKTIPEHLLRLHPVPYTSTRLLLNHLLQRCPRLLLTSFFNVGLNVFSHLHSQNQRIFLFSILSFLFFSVFPSLTKLLWSSHIYTWQFACVLAVAVFWLFCNMIILTRAPRIWKMSWIVDWPPPWKSAKCTTLRVTLRDGSCQTTLLVVVPDADHTELWARGPSGKATRLCIGQ